MNRRYVTLPLATDGAEMPLKGPYREQTTSADVVLFSTCHAARAPHPSCQGQSPLHHRTPHHSKRCVAPPANHSIFYQDKQF